MKKKVDYYPIAKFNIEELVNCDKAMISYLIV